jgi:hypothetical protein
MSLKPGQSLMCCIGISGGNPMTGAAHIVEGMHGIRVFCESFGCCDVLKPDF